MNKPTFQLLTLVTMIILFAGCATQQGLFKNAEKRNTIEAYETYLSKYPNGEYAAEAKYNMINLKYKYKYGDESKKQKSAELQEFINSNPQSEFTIKAQDEIQNLKYGFCEKENSIDVYQNFLKEYPTGEYAEKAQKEIIKLEFKEANNKYTVEAYEKFINAYPDNEFTPTAIELRDELKSLDVNGILNLKSDAEKIGRFKKIVQKSITDTKNKFYLLSKFYTALKKTCENNSNLIPFSKSEKSFFNYIAGLSYIPTIRDNSMDYNSFIDVMTLLLSEVMQLEALYLPTHIYESAYLIHNIGKVSLMIYLESDISNFKNINFSDVKSRAFIYSLSTMLGGKAKLSGMSDYAFKQHIAKRVSESMQLPLMHKIVVPQLINRLFLVPDSDKKTKQFILTELSEWVEIYLINNDSILKLEGLAAKEKNKKLKKLAALVAKKAAEAQKLYN